MGDIHSDESEWAVKTLSVYCTAAFDGKDAGQSLSDLQRPAILERDTRSGRRSWRHFVDIQLALRRELDQEKRTLPEPWKLLCFDHLDSTEAKYTSRGDPSGFSVGHSSWVALALGADGKSVTKTVVSPSPPYTLSNERGWDANQGAAKRILQWAAEGL